jgi:hypothetical protein
MSTALSNIFGQWWVRIAFAVITALPRLALLGFGGRQNRPPRDEASL